MSDLRDKLRAPLTEFDQKATTLLGEVAAEFSAQPGYFDALVSLADDAATGVSSGATWLIKAHLEAGNTLTPHQTTNLISNLPGDAVWSAQLHVCQSVQHLDIPESAVRQLANWLMPLLDHQRPFLRAWSVDALCRIGAEHAPVAAKARAALKKAEQDTAASVRARARAIARDLSI